jgi:O-Antigen ligase
MELLAVLGLGVAAIWLVVLARNAGSLPDSWAAHSVMLLIVVECVLGAAFFNRSLGPVPVTLDRVLLGAVVLLTLVIPGSRFLRTWHISARQTDSLPDENHGPAGKPETWHSRNPWRLALPGWTSLDWAVAVWILVLCASTFLHDFRFRDDLPLRRLLFFNLLPAALCLVIRCGVWTSVTVTRLQGCVLGLGAWLAVTGICEWQGWHGLVFPRHIVDPAQAEFLGRARGPLLNPVINGMWLNAALAVACLWLGGSRGGWRWAMGLCIPLLLAGSFATLTRSVWLGSGLVLGLMILLPLRPRMRVGVCFAGLVAGLALFGVLGDELNRFKRDRNVSVAEMSQSASLRPLLAIVAWEMLKDRPLTGFGFGQYPAAKKPYHWTDGHDLPLQQALPYMQHNVVLAYATETGLVGVAALLALLGSGIWQALQLVRREALFSEPAFRIQGWLTFCVAGNYLVNGMFHDVSIIPMSHSQLMLFLGLAASLAAVPARSSQHLPAPEDSSLTAAAGSHVRPVHAT